MPLSTDRDNTTARAGRFQKLAEAALSITAAPDLDATLRLVTEQARLIVGAHRSVTSLTCGADWSQAITTVSLSDKYARWRGSAAKPDGSGIHSTVCRTNKPVRMTQAELKTHPAWGDFGRHKGDHPPIRGWLAAPLVARNGGNLGLIQLSDKCGGEFTEEDEAILVQLAQFASVAIERARTEEALQERNKRLGLFSDAAAQLLSGDDPECVVQRLFRSVSEHLGLDVCFNFLVNDEGDALRLDSCVGIDDETARRLARLEFGQAICGTVAQTGQPLYAPDIQTSDDPLVRLVKTLGIRAYACSPLMADGRLVGTLSFGTRRRDRFSEDDLSFFRTISHYLSVVKERRRAETALRESESRARDQLIELEALYEAAPIGLALLSPDLRYLRINDVLAEMNGIPAREHLGRSVRDIVPDAADVAEPVFRRVAETGEPMLGLEFHAETAAQPETRRVWRESAFPLTAPDGAIFGIGVTVQDVTEQKRIEERQRLLMAELNHRVKNTLAVVQSIAAQTLRRASSLEGFAKSFNGRLRALASANSLLTHSQWRSASLERLARQTLKAHGTSKGGFETRGPALELSPKQTLALSLVLHELATNAAKYGALSVQAGRVEVRWAVTVGDGGGRVLRLDWIEQGGPPVDRPRTEGFGTVLIRRTIPHDLDGTVDLAFAPDGLRCAIAIPWEPDAPTTLAAG